MENVENKLQNYRLLRRRKEQIKHLKDTIQGFFMFGGKYKNSNEQPDKIKCAIQACGTKVYLINSWNSRTHSQIDASDVVLLTRGEISENYLSGGKISLLKYALHIVYLALWLTLYLIAIELQFGIVFLMCSAFAGLYLNTRTGSKEDDEISAYSVFNKNCESIDGTLKAEQFEREIGIK